MDMDALKPILAGLVRHGLTSLGGFLVASGYMQSSDTAAFIGGGMVIAGMLWSWWQKAGQAKLLALMAKMKPVAPPSATTSEAVKAATDAAKAVASILLVAFVVSLFLAGGAAQAQVRKPVLTGNIVADIAAAKTNPTTAVGSIDAAVSDFNAQVQKITKDVVDKAITDVTAAQTDAQNHNDQISKPCWDANLALLKSLPTQWENPPTFPVGLALGLQIQRDLLNSITGNDAGSLKVACAALLGDQLKIVANLGGLLGIKIATGGLF